MMFFWVLILVGGVLLVLWLLRQGRPGEPGSPPGSRPLAILQERYARGELTKEQYEQMRRDLTGQP
jgi:putative membrane protein